MRCSSLAASLGVTAMALGLAACQAPMPDSATPAPDTTATSTTPPMTNPGVTLTLDRATYAPGADVVMTLVNNSQRDLGYNPCTRIVEREANGNWAPVPEPDRVCTMELRLLGKGDTVQTQTDLPKPLNAGRYRIALLLSDESPTPGAPTRAVSQPFAVQ